SSWTRLRTHERMRARRERRHRCGYVSALATLACPFEKRSLYEIAMTGRAPGVCMRRGFGRARAPRLERARALRRARAPWLGRAGRTRGLTEPPRTGRARALWLDRACVPRD